jgi:hypothetical protein
MPGEEIQPIERWRWVVHANCHDVHPDIFHDMEGGGDKYLHNFLTDLCAACPVQPQCLRHAMTNDEYGWWGGSTRAQRQRWIASERRAHWLASHSAFTATPTAAAAATSATKTPANART